jgi:hypothetical protein
MWHKFLLALILAMCIDVYPGDENNQPPTQVIIDEHNFKPTESSSTTITYNSPYKCPYTFPNVSVRWYFPLPTAFIGGIGGSISGYYAGNAIAAATFASHSTTNVATAVCGVLGVCIGTSIGACIPYCAAGIIMLCCCKKRT